MASSRSEVLLKRAAAMLPRRKLRTSLRRESGSMRRVSDSMRSRRGSWKAERRKKKFSSVTVSVMRPQSGQGVPAGTSTKISSETQ